MNLYSRGNLDPEDRGTIYSYFQNLGDIHIMARQVDTNVSKECIALFKVT
jgi:hypothetical protein